MLDVTEYRVTCSSKGYAWKLYKPFIVSTTGITTKVVSVSTIYILYIVQPYKWSLQLAHPYR